MRKTYFFTSFLRGKYLNASDVETLKEMWDSFGAEYQRYVSTLKEKDVRYQLYDEVFYPGVGSDLKSGTLVELHSLANIFVDKKNNNWKNISTMDKKHICNMYGYASTRTIDKWIRDKNLPKIKLIEIMIKEFYFDSYLFFGKRD